MPSSSVRQQRSVLAHRQMPLDFVKENQYINATLQGVLVMSDVLFEKLDKKISELLDRQVALKGENQALAEENKRLLQEREGLQGRIDAILSRLEGV